MANNISNTLETLFGKMENYVSTKSVVGDAIVVGDTTILPLVDVSFGVGAGGAGSNEIEKNSSEGGGGGLGAKISPSAVLVVSKDSVQLFNVKNQNSVNKLIDIVPGIASKLSEILNNKSKNKDSDDKTDLTKETV